MDDARLLDVARELSKHRGVVGVFRGLRRRGRSWGEEEVLSVHVRRKRAGERLKASEAIPPSIEGFPTDVVAVGRARLHAAVDSNDQLVAGYDPHKRQSALAALAQDSSGTVLGLGSGHGLLPVDAANKTYTSVPPTTNGNLSTFVQEDPADTAGFVALGSFGTDVDAALVSFTTLKPPLALLGHLFARLPIEVRADDPPLGEFVQQASPGRGRITGQVVSTLALTPVSVGTDDGFSVSYTHVLTVSGATSLPFSVPGDSGSIVFDAKRRALGFVVAGGADPRNPQLRVTYVLRNFSRLKATLGSSFPLFFSE